MHTNALWSASTQYLGIDNYRGCSLGLHLILLGTTIIHVALLWQPSELQSRHCLSQQRYDDRFRLSNATPKAQHVVLGSASAGYADCAVHADAGLHLCSLSMQAKWSEEALVHYDSFSY